MRFGLTASNRWPVAIVTVLLAQVAFGVWMSRIARADPHFAVEPDYYSRAVNWDATMAQSRLDRALGWQATASLVRTAGTAATLQVSLRDSTGAPVRADSVSAAVLAVAHAGDVSQLTLAPAGDTYTVPVAVAARGLWEVQLRAVRGTDVFTAKLRPELQ
ncbi:MAG: FixH family protein [Gemmatimonadaceae bacterium]|nr:FixH family protein [Gemmatimonadaceae bacterium]